MVITNRLSKGVILKGLKEITTNVTARTVGTVKTS
jgi:hypothetical protein